MTYVAVTGKDSRPSEEPDSADTEITVEFKGMPEKTPKECLQALATILDGRLKILAKFSNEESNQETCGVTLYCFHTLAKALEVDPKDIELEFVKSVLRKMSATPEDKT